MISLLCKGQHSEVAEWSCSSAPRISINPPPFLQMNNEYFLSFNSSAIQIYSPEKSWMTPPLNRIPLLSPFYIEILKLSLLLCLKPFSGSHNTIEYKTLNMACKSFRDLALGFIRDLITRLPLMLQFQPHWPSFTSSNRSQVSFPPHGLCMHCSQFLKHHSPYSLLG